MSRVKTANTRPEVTFRKILWHAGFRYRCNYKKAPGCPDIAFVGWRIAIFIDGDFWHGNNWERRQNEIKSNRSFWIPKIERNIQRDREVEVELAALGWRYLRFWESEIKKELGGVFLKTLQFVEENSGEKWNWER
jgi:DNA mismatch endonuclease (patch repair protein)